MKKINKSPPLFTIQCYEDRQLTPIRKADLIPVQFVNDKAIRPLDNQEALKPPPPPPMPLSNGHQNGEHRKLDSHNPKLVDKDLDIPTTRKVATLSRIPTPDYNNKTDITVHLKPKNVKEENAEIESMESYKLKNPDNVTLKPPSNYFIKAPNGSATMKKHTRPVSVTIGEYVNNIGRKEPSKLDFLNGDKVDAHRITKDEPITSRLQSELALTLSRSNLRKKTEALGDGCR